MESLNCWRHSRDCTRAFPRPDCCWWEMALAAKDVAVAPYPVLANFYFSPLKVYEYMAAGLPVVASRVGQLENLIESEVTGLHVTPGDVSALADALERIKSEPHLRVRLGQAARSKVIRHHTWDAAVERILGL